MKFSIIAFITMLSTHNIVMASPQTLETPKLSSQAIPYEINRFTQTAINITLYPQNTIMINEKRKVRLKPGTNKVLIHDIPNEIIPDSLLIRINKQNLVNLLEYNFHSGQVSEKFLFENSVGEPIYIRSPKVSDRSQEGTLLSFSDTKAWVLSEGLMYPVNKDQIAFKNPTYNVFARPVLTIKLKSTKELEGEIELNYLAKGITWNSGYTAIINEDEKTLDLNNWINIQNTCGVNIKKAKINIFGMIKNQNSLFSFPQSISIGHKRSKNISYFNEQKLPLVKNFRVYLQNPSSRINEGISLTPQVESWLTIQKMTTPSLSLPEGNVRVFQRDSKGNVLYKGEHRSEAVSANKLFSVRLNESTELTSKLIQTDYRKLGAHVIEAGYQLNLDNHTQNSQQVFIIQPIPGQWSILRETHPHEIENEHKIKWTLTIPANDKLSLRFRVRMTLD